MESRSDFSAINGSRLYYETAGERPALVFVHGFTLDTRMWDDQFKHFAGRHRVIRYDVRGFGRSAVPTREPFSNHSDLAALLDHLGVDSAHVCGLSMGGGITLDFALEYPERTASAILIDSTLGGFRDWSPEFRALIREFPGIVDSTEMLEAKRRAWIDSALFAPALTRPNVAAALSAMVGDWSGWQWFNRANHLDPDPPPAARLGDLRCPVLALVGESGLRDFHYMAAKIEAEAPNARYLVIPGAGHMANMEEPAAVNAAIAEFLGALP